ncbi:MAG: FMN-binding negative transcriptional regulator [Chloroflexia bacterium]|nr:FMN-binding negative transcriptional regulator [Chloroflexia bacterium]
MYLPPAFQEDRLEVKHDLIHTYPLGLLITAGAAGLIANPIPFILYPDEGTYGTLRAHMARANPQWLELATVPECLAVFQGAEDYISPSWYATKQETHKVVPTWNYATVHVWGKPQIVQSTAWLYRQIDDLTRSQEGARPVPWQVTDAPEDFITAQMKGIIGVEIAITRIEGKWKVSQNRPEADHSGVVEGLRAQGETSKPMADLVAERTKAHRLAEKT